MRRLCCDASAVTVTEDAKGNPLDVGHAHRKWLDAHHVMHWVDGGKMSLENTLLCSCARPAALRPQVWPSSFSTFRTAGSEDMR